MERSGYRIFSPGVIAGLRTPNRLVRSATWDTPAVAGRRMTPEVLETYRRAAEGGIGMIIAGEVPAVPSDAPESGTSPSYEDVRIDGIEEIVETVHSAAPECVIIAQIGCDCPGCGPSSVRSPFTREPAVELTVGRIASMVEGTAAAIEGIRNDGFQGVQLHAAHGGLLSAFLSPYTNRRTDRYGGSPENRARIVREIISAARRKVGSFPILVKMNATDHLDGGIDRGSLPELSAEIEKAGADAIELSGGMWDCLVRSEADLGFPPVPAPESHTRIASPEKQSYYLRYAEELSLGIPLILAGGNRDVDRLEEIVRRRAVDFIALCRPLIREPGLPLRWLEGRGGSGTACVSCNACIYDMYTGLERGAPSVAACLHERDRGRLKEAERWLSTWAAENALQ